MGQGMLGTGLEMLFLLHLDNLQIIRVVNLQWVFRHYLAACHLYVIWMGQLHLLQVLLHIKK